MRPLHALVLVLALVGLSIGAFVLLRGDGGRGRLAAAATSADAAPRTEAVEQELDLAAPERDLGEERTSAPASPAPVRAAEVAASEPPRAGERASTLVGRVVDEQGAPLAGVTVLAAPDSPWARRALERGGGADFDFARATRAQSAADGRFRIAVEEAARVLLALGAPGRAPFLSAFAARAGEEVPVGDLVLVPGVVLAGRVLDEGGRPVEGVRITRADEDALAFDLDTSASEPLASTDAAGGFRIDRLAPGPWALRLDHEDHPARVERGETRRAGERQEGLVFTLEEGLALNGRVLDADASTLAALEVVASPARSVDEEPAEAEYARTTRRIAPGADGRFELRGLRADESYRVQARSAPRGPRGFPGRGMTPVVVAEAGAQDVELRLRPLTSLCFQVVDDESGEPIEEFRAWASAPFPVALRAPDGSARSQHPEGRACFEELPRLQSGALELRVEALGYQPFERDDLRLAEGRDNDLGTLRLRPAPILTVRVLDELDGRPIQGARVRLQPVQREEGGFASLELDELELDGDLAPTMPGSSRSGRTDQEGLVRLTSMPGESARLVVRAKGYAPRDEGPVAMGEGALEREVRLGPGGSVLVRVVDPAGAPAAGVGIEHRGPQGADGPAFGAPRVTDAAGELRFEDLAAGPHSFRIGDGTGGVMTFAQGGAQVNIVRRSSAEREEGGRDWTEVVVLPREQASLTLVCEPRVEVRGVVREAGVPLAGATVTLGKAEEPAELAGFAGLGGAGGLEARTDHEGRFALRDVEAGTYRLAVRHAERSMPWEQELLVGEQGAEVVLDLPIVGIRGRVRDAEGQPLAGVRVSAARPESQTRSVRRMIMISDGGDVHGDVVDGDPSLRPVVTDAEGRYELKGLVPDVELVVKASGAGVQPAQSEPVRVAPGEVAEGIDLELQAGGALPVEVLSAQGDPGMGMVEARWLGEAAGVEPKNAFAGPSGRVRLDGLRPGKWRVKVQPLAMGGEPGEPVEREVEVLVGENEPLRLTLP